MSVSAAPKKGFVCKTCHDTGKVSALCALCHGSKWMWKCQPKERGGKGWATYEVLSNDGGGIKTTEGWCGYGTTYRALHKDCPNVRKRLPCPDCKGDGKKVSTGKVRADCPDCDGHGHVRTVRYIVRDTSVIADGSTLELGRLREFVERRKLTDGELSDYREENPHCKAYDRLDELLRAVKTWKVVVSRDEGADKPDGESSVKVAGKSDAQPPETSAVVSSASAATPTAPPISDAIRRLIEIEEAHEREMRKRKFGDLPKN